MDTAKLEEIERLAKECLQAEEDARNSPSPYDADLAASKADLLALRFVTDHAADLVRAARRYAALKDMARKNDAYDVYGPGANWTIGVYATDSRQTFDAAIDAAMEVGRE